MRKGTAIRQLASGSEIQLEELSQREIEVLRLLALGHSNQEIAQMLVIAENTVKTHLKHLYGKLDAHNRVQAVIQAQVLRLLN